VSAGRPRETTLWITGAALVCASSLWGWLRPERGDSFRLPVTPVDRVDGARARQWLFLESSRPHVPPRASFTVLAADPDVEMALYMMSFGVFADGLPLPTRYYGNPTPEFGREAEYVLAFGLREPPDPRARLVAEVPGGAVYVREVAR